MKEITKGTKVHYIDIQNDIIILDLGDVTSFISIDEIMRIDINNELIKNQQFFKITYENGSSEEYFVDNEDDIQMLDYILFDYILDMDIESDDDFEEVEEKAVEEKKLPNKSNKKTTKKTK